jgi:hypothetical protein
MLSDAELDARAERGGRPARATSASAPTFDRPAGSSRLPAPIQDQLRALAVAVERLRGTLTTSELGPAIDAVTDLADQLRDDAIDELARRQVAADGSGGAR